MTALFYFLGFLSGVAAVFVAKLIIMMRNKKLTPSDDMGKGFLSIINY